MYIFGGEREKRQISAIQNCRITRIGDLPFDFYLGGCGYFQNQFHFCFGAENDKCYTLDNNFAETGQFSTTNVPHTNVPIAVGDGQYFV